LSTAILSNDSSAVLSWLENLPEVDELLWVHLVQILQQSAYHLSVDVVNLFQPPSKCHPFSYFVNDSFVALTQELLSGIINFADTNGMVWLH